MMWILCNKCATLCFCQIYNEMIRDLLQPGSGYLELREDSKGVQVSGLSSVSANSTQEVCPLIAVYTENTLVQSISTYTCTSESEMFLFDPYKKYIQSNNEMILDQGTPIKTSLVANIRAAYYIINNYFFISQAKHT